HTAFMAELKYRGRMITREDILYKGADHNASRGEPPHAIQEAMRGLPMETSQRCFTRYGVPRPVADAGPCLTDRATAGEVPASQPAGSARTASAGTGRHDTGGEPSGPDPAREICTGAANSRGTPV